MCTLPKPPLEESDSLTSDDNQNSMILAQTQKYIPSVFSSLTLYEAAFVRLYCNGQTQHQFTTTKVSILFLIMSWGRLTEALLHVSSSGHRPERESLFRTGVFTAEGKSRARTTSQLKHIHDLYMVFLFFLIISLTSSALSCSDSFHHHGTWTLWLWDAGSAIMDLRSVGS